MELTALPRCPTLTGSIDMEVPYYFQVLTATLFHSTILLGISECYNGLREVDSFDLT